MKKQSIKGMCAMFAVMWISLGQGCKKKKNLQTGEWLGGEGFFSILRHFLMV